MMFTMTERGPIISPDHLFDHLSVGIEDAMPPAHMIFRGNEDA